MRLNSLPARTAAKTAALALTLAALVAPLATANAKTGRSGGILPGATAKDPINIDAGKLDYFDKEQKLIYSGSVIVVNGPSTLKASRMIIFLDDNKSPNAQPGAATNDRVKHIDVEGPVTLVSKDQVGTGERGSFDKAENKVYLTGNVTLTQGDNVVKGDRLVYDVTTGQATVQGGQSQGGRVRSIFTPAEKSP